MDPLPDSDLGVKNVLQTEADMRSAVFCVCPPGKSFCLSGFGSAALPLRRTCAVPSSASAHQARAFGCQALGHLPCP